jgi:regulatory protein
VRNLGSSRPRKADSEDELYAYAIGALGRRMRSVAELKRLLARRVDKATEYGQTLLDLVIRRLKDQGYLNDLRYAAAYSSLRRDNEKLGRRRVTLDLKARGVHAEVIDQAVAAAYNDVDEEAQARAYLRRKRIAQPKDQKQMARVFRQLLRAGFRGKAIFAILKQWEADERILRALEEEDPQP